MHLVEPALDPIDSTLVSAVAGVRTQGRIVAVACIATTRSVAGVVIVGSIGAGWGVSAVVGVAADGHVGRSRLRDGDGRDGGSEGKDGGGFHYDDVCGSSGLCGTPSIDIVRSMMADSFVVRRSRRGEEPRRTEGREENEDSAGLMKDVSTSLKKKPPADQAQWRHTRARADVELFSRMPRP